MAVLVLALGAVMAVAGAGLMAYGNGYISVEQGWSAFIAGSVLLTGGLVTLALGVAVRALGELRAALTRVAPAAEATLPRLMPADADPSFGARADAAPRAAEPLAAFPEPVPHVPDTHEAREPSFAAERDEGERVAAAPAPDEAAMTDWLDRSFAELDRERAEPRLRRTDEPEPQRAEPPHRDAIHADQPSEAALVRLDPPRSEPAHGGAVIDHDDAASDEPSRAAPPAHDALASPGPERNPAAETGRAAEPAAALPATSSPVIGRYESEGTSYVMYADGSIEAQSEAGIYRFSSMAELKSFIEG